MSNICFARSRKCHKFGHRWREMTILGPIVLETRQIGIKSREDWAWNKGTRAIRPKKQEKQKVSVKKWENRKIPPSALPLGGTIKQ